jgi:hypothetical protein
MTLYEFNLHPYVRQLVAIFDTGIFLARRWEEEDGINLYHLSGDFFVELYYDTHMNQIVQLRSFTSARPLENYTAYVPLPENWTR